MINIGQFENDDDDDDDDDGNALGRERQGRTQGKIDLRNESGRPMKVKVVGEVSEKWN